MAGEPPELRADVVLEGGGIKGIGPGGAAAQTRDAGQTAHSSRPRGGTGVDCTIDVVVWP